jgi:hypothetical protein
MSINLFSQDLDFVSDYDIINNAIFYGDLETLYKFVQTPEGRNQRLVTNANQTIRRYTLTDDNTAKFRNNRMEARIRNVGRELMENIFIDPAQHLPAVVSRLTSGITDPFLSVKAIHDWICDNIIFDTDTYFRRASNSQDYVSVIRNKKATAAGYAALFDKMCNLANIDSVTIKGYTKSYGYTGSLGNTPNHEWNAVRLDNRWYPVDVTMDAGYLVNRTFVKKYSSDYLFLDSRPFLYSHLPAENRHQFFVPVITKETFVEEPFLAGVFFRYGLDLGAAPLKYSNQITESFTIQVLNRNNSISINHALRNSQLQVIEGASWHQRSGFTFSIMYDVPDTQDYTGVVLAASSNERRVTEVIPINKFEQEIIPMLENLVEIRSILDIEKEHFLNYYKKVESDGNYYFQEDQFNTARNSAVLKVHPMVGLPLNALEPVLTFSIKAQSPYTGYKNDFSVRFPEMLKALYDVSNTTILGPINGVLAGGSSEKFVIKTNDFSRIAIIYNEQNMQFSKNSEGNFELVFRIPNGMEILQISGSKDGRTYSPLLKYTVK